MLDLAPAQPEDVLKQFRKQCIYSIQSGDYAPFVWPYRAFGPYLLILYLLIPPKYSIFINWIRYPIFAIIVYLSVSSIQECRSSAVTIAYGIGLLNAWAILWSASLIIFNDARKNFKRIERRSQDTCLSTKETDGFASNLKTSDTIGLQARSPFGNSANKNLDKPSTKRQVYKGRSPKSHQNSVSRNSSDVFKWQQLPQGLLHRLNWATDLVTNFRGVGWAHQIPGTLPPPPQIQASLHHLDEPPKSHHTYPSRESLLRSNLPTFLLCCIILDILKALTSRDPYFWSLPSSTPSPFPYPRVSRLVLSLIFTYTSLLNIFVLAPLGFACLLGPKILGEHASPWLYSPYFGNPVQIWKKGLAGFWGQWWHQLFRYAFEATGDFVGGDLLGLEKKSQLGSLVRVVCAFLCSAFLHTCASYTTLGDTKPIQGSFAFFAVQPIGIVTQRTLTAWMRKRGLRDKIPAWVRGLGNVLVFMGWCWLTGPLVADDFAAGGIWLYEPLPVSFVRGMMGEGWWRWGGEWVRWHSGDKWWQSGLAF